MNSIAGFQFDDRFDAGRRLAVELQSYAHYPNAIVLALPSGGVPVGYEIARALGVPLDVFMVRKLGLPGHEQLAMGAIANGSIQVLNDAVISQGHVPERVIASVAARERAELDRRTRLFRNHRPALDPYGQTVLLVDDGLATGATMRAAVLALYSKEPGRLVVAVPVAAEESCRAFRDLVDQIICLITPEPFGNVGSWYRSYPSITDEEVGSLLAAHSLVSRPV